MLNFADYVINVDWGTPLLVLTVGLLLGMLFLAALVQWLDVWREAIQSETENKTPVDFAAYKAGRRHRHLGWRTRHI